MSLRKISALARPVDLRFSTNRAIAAVTAILFVGDFLRRIVTGSDWLESVRASGGLGLSVFLAWALCREIDPDRDLSAFVAAGVALAGMLLWGSPSIAVALWMLLAVRIVNRSTGLRATAVDSMGFLALASWLAFHVWWPLGMLTVLAFLLDAWLDETNRKQLLFGALTLALTLGAAIIGEGSLESSSTPLASGLLVILMSLAFVPVVVAAGELTSLGDDTKERLCTARVRSGQMLLLAAGASAVCWAGFGGLVVMWPLWSAVLGASMYLLVKSAIV